MAWLKQQLFDFCCQGLAYCPEQSLLFVNQIFQDNNDNEIRLTMNQYTANILKACECSTKSCFEVDVVMYSADNMNPALKQEMESNKKDHYKAKACDWMTQLAAFQDLMKHAIPAEEKVLSLHKEVRSTATSAMLSIPGFGASVLNATAD